MPLFGRSNAEPAPATTTSEVPNRRKSMFGRKNETTPATTTNQTTHSSGVLHRHEDSSIVNARDQVRAAEKAEQDADRALLQARAAVKSAREHVRRLEKEAAEEARLAKIKQKQAHAIGKRGKALGRHEHV